MVDTLYCVHCGAAAKHPVYKTVNAQNLAFCCNGCVQVYEFMHEEDELTASQQASQTIQSDKGPAVPAETETTQTISFQVTGMTCANCVATVQRQLRSVPGVLDVSVLLDSERATVKLLPDRLSMSDLRKAVKKAGYDIPLDETFNRLMTS
jgi:copper chaperone CopZ